MLVGSYSTVLVLLSIVIAMIASYTALDLSARVAASHGRVAQAWLAAGAGAMGLGIWSMHFIGMLAFSLPIPLGYDLGYTLLSLAIAVGVSGYALERISCHQLSARQLAWAALWMGGGICGMHYTGMAALRMAPAIVWHPGWFAVSVAIAVGAAGAALWIAVQLKREQPHVRLLRAGAAVVMGLAIVGMHYSGMAAADFPLGSVCLAVSAGLDTHYLALFVVVGSTGVLGMVLLLSLFDARMESRTAQLSLSLQKANQELTQLALHDNLTRLPNRILLEDRLNQAQKKAARDGGTFAVLFMDLDGFKSVNDSLGHQMGDLLLLETAMRLAAALRAQDTLARIGGDEFVAVLEDLEMPGDVVEICERLTAAIRRPFEFSRVLHLSISIGVAIHPADGEDGRTLMTNADAAMYAAKQAGRDGYRFFEASMNNNAHDLLLLQSELHQALAGEEFRLHYQPKFEAGSGRMLGVEALIRWQSPTRGMVAPAAFIPVAEKTGLIVSIGAWVLDRACAQMREWLEAGRSPLNVAVNLSPAQFRHPQLVAMVRETLQRHRIEACWLTLEITESTAMDDAEASLARLGELAEMGVRLSIDDFGTGYSSLAYLKRLPASELKIDRSFVHELAPGSDDAAIVAAVVALARALGLTVVAEGVETAPQRDFLAALGCDALQGFHLGRPVPAEQIGGEPTPAAVDPAPVDPAAAGPDERMPDGPVAGDPVGA
ncbi:putative bifunctional diguanylate cyclase/phosphodiesterase [Chitinimonas koreensis]|uniref:putative bifunctional diguanylate cyclase/phosphodiesterase n=1 Tax=Chitinimonas koreensis TaxID=356302 RepID=UPI0004125717|nr:EAL domain-containing protein [Chitinimonas koreensis]QNM96066.1 bifunctional diguanylate cyclase/phosphodiesterase [Chitinimonas koreensis]